MESVVFLIRASGDAAAVGPAVRTELRAQDPNLAVSDTRTFDDQLAVELDTNNLLMALFTGFASIGLLVAVCGIYGITAFSRPARTTRSSSSTATPAR